MNDDRPQDEFVSATYRELASERAPGHLDDKVLAMAADIAERPRYSRSMRWTRPLAWAATIALTLAITLEITQVPVPESVPEVESPGPALPAESQELPASQDFKELRQAKSIPEAMSAEKTALGRSVAKRAADEPPRANRMREAEGLIEGDVAEEAMPSAAMKFEVKDADMLQRADDMTQLQDSSINQPDREEYAALASTAAVPVAVNECTDEARAEPDSWLECINALEESGDTDAAARQRENLKELFPDFKLP